MPILAATAFATKQSRQPSLLPRRSAGSRTVHGKASFEDQRYASRYALTWLPQPARGKHATNRWREIKTAEAAKAILTVAMDRREAKRNAKAARGIKGQSRGPKLKAAA